MKDFADLRKSRIKNLMKEMPAICTWSLASLNSSGNLTFTNCKIKKDCGAFRKNMVVPMLEFMPCAVSMSDKTSVCTICFVHTDEIQWFIVDDEPRLEFLIK